MVTNDSKQTEQSHLTALKVANQNLPVLEATYHSPTGEHVELLHKDCTVAAYLQKTVISASTMKWLLSGVGAMSLTVSNDL